MKDGHVEVVELRYRLGSFELSILLKEIVTREHRSKIKERGGVSYLYWTLVNINFSSSQAWNQEVLHDIGYFKALQNHGS